MNRFRNNRQQEELFLVAFRYHLVLKPLIATLHSFSKADEGRGQMSAASSG